MANAKHKTEAQVFAEFGIGTGDADAALRKLIHGQRAINGKLYKAIDLILDALCNEKSKTAMSKSKSKKLAKAKKFNEGVPGPSPGCTGG